MSHPSPTEYPELAAKLGDIQSLAASISRRAKTRPVSQVFSHVCDLIWRYFDQTPHSVHRAGQQVHQYLSSFDEDEFEPEASSVKEDIRTMFSLVEDFCNLESGS